MVLDQFADRQKVQVRALYVAEYLDLRALKAEERLAGGPMMIRVRDSGCVVLFRYGVAVFFDVNSLEASVFLDHLQSIAKVWFETPEQEDAEIYRSDEQPEGMDDDRIRLSELSLERLQLVAEALARGVVLNHYEKRVSRAFDTVEPLAQSLKKRRRRGPKARDLLDHIGETLLSMHQMVGRVEVTEPPELLWERPELERFYARLADEYMIRERSTALERKLDLIARTAQTLLDLLQTKQGLRVEWYIVILIVVEIILTLYAMFFEGKF